jgi:hypothetical protein
LQGQLYALGGWGAGGTALRSVERLDGRRWLPAKDMRSERAGFTGYGVGAQP